MQRRIPASAAVAMGFALLDVWCDLLGHSGATVPAALLIQDALTNGRVIWNVSLVGLCGAMVVAPQVFSARRKAFDAGVPFVAALFTVLYGLAFNPGVSGVVPALCIVVTGICYGWLEVRLFCEAARLPSVGQIIVAVVASRAIKAILAAILGLLGISLQIAVDAIAVLAVGACLILASRALDADAACEVDVREAPQADHIMAVVLIAVYPTLNAVARALSPLGFWGDASIVGASGLLPVSAAALAFLLVCFAVFHACDEQSVFTRLAIALTVLLGSLLLTNGVLGPLPNKAGVLGGAALAIELFSHSLFWLAAILSSRSMGRPMLRSAASAELVMSSAAILLGIILQQVSDLSQDIVVVALYAVMAVLAFAVWRSRRWMTEHAQMLHPSNSENELKDVCIRIAREKQLTPRETDVLELLAEGRSARTSWRSSSSPRRR